MNDEYSDLSQEMFHLIQTMRRMSLVKMKSQHGIHHGQGHVLGMLMKHNDVAQKELAQWLNIRPASLTDLLEKLERDQLIVRSRDQNDRRVVRVSITEKGQQIVRQNIQVRREIEATMFGSLSGSEIQTMTAILQKMSQSLQQQIKKAGDGQ